MVLSAKGNFIICILGYALGVTFVMVLLNTEKCSRKIIHARSIQENTVVLVITIAEILLT